MLMLISRHFCVFVFVLNLTFDMRYILFSFLSFYVCTNKDKCRMLLGDQSKSCSVLIYCLFNTQCLSLFVGVGRYLLQILLKIKIFIVLLQLSKGIVCLSFCLKLFYIIFFGKKYFVHINDKPNICLFKYLFSYSL